ncbi:MAG: DegT/DnrJ/EryC1/StrS family aminotransferase [Candidatus Omnitrophica bacterium]|nr:DegT/DnrJ/EryC1/StrS family aminotransferase [Candidatus Omnitrophota bacterium]
MDIDRHSWCLSPEALEASITKRTKAIIVVGLLGNMPDVNALTAIAARHRIPMIEDAAESLGALYLGKPAGAFGAVGVYSFNGTKLLVTGEGGMLVTDDKRLYERAKRLAHHGINKAPGARYYWSHELGYKYQYTNVQAALGLAQLDRLEELVEQRRRIFHWYAQRLHGVEGLSLNQETPGSRSTFWITAVMVSRAYGLRKEAIVRALEQRGIGGRPFFYPLSSMPPFKPFCRGRDMRTVNPVSYALSPYGVCLPSAATLGESEVAMVCDALVEILRRSHKRRLSRRTLVTARC